MEGGKLRDEQSDFTDPLLYPGMGVEDWAMETTEKIFSMKYLFS